MSEANSEQSLPGDKRLLSRLKLTLWTVTVLLVIHALPGRFIQEMYPVTRWAMFSEEQLYPPDQTVEFELDITDRSGNVFQVTASSLYSDLVTNSYGLSVNIVHQAMQTEDVGLQAEYREALIERISSVYNIEVSTVVIWALAYDVDLSRLPHIDYSMPTQRDFIGQFTADDLSYRGSENVLEFL